MKSLTEYMHMRLPPLSIPSASAAVPPSSALATQPAAVFDLRSLPPQLAASSVIREHAGRDLFISGSWISTAAEKALLNESQKRVLLDLIAHFRNGSLDLNEEFSSDRILLHFNNAEHGPCEAACKVNEQGEVQSIMIRSRDRPEILQLSKPAREAASAAVSSSGKMRQHQLQVKMAAITQSLEKKGFSSQQLDKIRRKGGAKAPEAVIQNWTALQKLDLSKDDIVKIASNNGGALTLRFVIQNWAKLQELGLFKDDIVKIAGNDSGAKALEAVIQNWAVLQGLGLSKDDIVKIASNDGGTKALEAVIKYWTALQKLGLSTDDIVKIAGNNGGTKALETVIQKWGELQKLGLSKDDIVKIAGHGGGTPALETAIQKWGELQKLGLSKDDIVKIAGNDGGGKALETVTQEWGGLEKLGLSKDDIVKIAGHGGGAPALETAIQKWGELTTLEWIDKDNKKDKLTKNDIVKIASKDGAKNTLEAILSRKSWQDMLSKPELLMLMSSSHNASVALNWYLTYHARLLQSGLTKAQIITAAVSRTPKDKKKALEQAGVEAAPASSRKRGTSSAAAPAKRIKTEATEITRPFISTFPAPASEVDIERINTAQAWHTPVTVYPMIDLTDESGSAIGMSVWRVRHTEQTQLFTGKQIYHSALDQMFPIRDPANPARVHPNYADPADPTRCAGMVRLESVHFLKSGAKSTKFSTRPIARAMDENTLWKMLKDKFGSDHPYQNRSGFNGKKMFLDALLTSCRQELEACITGKQPPPSVHRVQVVEVTAEQCDSPDEARALQGQYGGVLKDYAEDQQPSLRNGRIVCLFAGARLETEEERDAYFAQLGQEVANRAQHDYSARVRKHGTQKKHVDWAPYGGGNMAQYFNSSFNAEGEVDPQGCNACFMPVTFKLRDKDGNKRTETMLAVIQYRTIEQDKQIKLDYGEKYKLAQEASAPMEAEAP